MLYDLDKFGSHCKRRYGLSDMTLVVAVRAHEHNPWVKDRLQILGDYYKPSPPILVVDFGSQGAHRREIEQICHATGIKRLYVDDHGVYSPATARNAGARAVDTELIFFSDIDCFGPRDLCVRLVEYANDIDLAAYFDQIINLPVYHLDEQVTRDFFRQEGAEEKSQWLRKALAGGVLTARDDVVDFVDPSSNFFVCHRQFFELMGGYNENFRGHGSEDFEFWLRFARMSGQFPLPDKPEEDHFGPLQRSFYGSKRYTGFRRLGEAMAFHAEVAGLRLAHLYHPRPREHSWYARNDWTRGRFNAQVEPFVKDPKRLVEYDWLPRTKSALVLLAHDWQYEFFLPLRLAGYRLRLLVEGEPDTYDDALEAIGKGEVDAIAIFNPYMKSHRKLRPFFELAKQSGLETIVVERGALPESWYYAPDVSYNDPEWSVETIDGYQPGRKEYAIAQDYQKALRTGRATLEDNADMAETMKKYGVYSRLHSQICFVPLQLDDDMAVTRYTDGFASYASFRDALPEVVRQNPNVLFFVKPHPLSNAPLGLDAPNVVVCDREDNVHALIELASAVVCYNSGVGLLALLHDKPVVTVGNAFYNVEGLGKRARDASHGVELAFGSRQGFLERDTTHMLAWLLWRKYSFFKAESSYRDFGHRRAHDYRNLRFYHLNVHGRTWSFRRAAVTWPLADSSYAAARIGTNLRTKPTAAQTRPRKGESKEANGRGRSTGRTLQRKLRKLQREPSQFLADSRHTPLRWLGGKLSG